MSKQRHSAGLVLWRSGEHGIEVLIAHPGGPFWANKHDGAWSIPKGEFDPEQDSAATAAAREFEEETANPAPDAATWIALGETTLKSGKRIVAWGARGDLNPETAHSNTFEIEWPPRSGRRISVPEIDEVRWCEPHEARQLLNPAQGVFIDRLIEALTADSSTGKND